MLSAAPIFAGPFACVPLPAPASPEPPPFLQAASARDKATAARRKLGRPRRIFGPPGQVGRRNPYTSARRAGKRDARRCRPAAVSVRWTRAYVQASRRSRDPHGGSMLVRFGPLIAAAALVAAC